MICKRPRLTQEQLQSKECEQLLKGLAKEESKYVKLLLLGTGESGKTTIIKQMKILQINGFSEEEKKAKIADILQNIHESIYSIISGMKKINPPLSITNEEVWPSEKHILDLGPDKTDEYTNEYFEHVKTLWADPDVQKAFARSNEYQLIDSAQHFLDQIYLIKQDNYVPSVQDILYCRVETRSISKIDFSVSVPKKYGGGKAYFSVFDVGGQRGHRNKWISVFTGIQAILFVIAASDFDQTLREDEKKNRLEESFQIFSDIFWSRWMSDAGKMVFLNKQDLLQKKIEQGKRIEDYFPKFRTYVLPKKVGSPGNEYERAKYFMRDEIIEIARNRPRIMLDGLNVGRGSITGQNENQDVYIHFTVATDTNILELIFNDVHNMIIKINILRIINE